MKAGSKVTVVQPPPIEGVVKGRRINPETDEIEMLVVWNEGGEEVQRWFDEDQLKEVVEASKEPSDESTGDQQ